MLDVYSWLGANSLKLNVPSTIADISLAENFKFKGKCQAELISQEKIFSDPRCPIDIQSISKLAYSNTYRIWGFVALMQEETELGQYFLREAIRLNPALLDDKANELVNFLLFNCTIDENQDHKSLLALVFSQLPGEVKSLLTDQYDWAIARGYLVKAVRAILWGRMELGHEYFSKASKQRADIDITFIQALIYQLISYEKEFGPEASQERLQKMVPYMIN